MTQLKPAQVQAVSLLAQGYSITDVAKELGIDRSTIHDWLKNNDVFLLELNTMKAECLETAKVKLNASVSSAIETIVDVMTSSDSDSTRLQAAKEILLLTGINAETIRDQKQLPLTLDAIQQQKAMQALNEKVNFFN